MRHFENQTGWNTRDLRRLVTAGIRAEGMDPKRYSVVLKRRRHGVTGLGWLGVPKFNLSIPAPSEANNADDNDGQMGSYLMRKIAQVLVHEVGHNQDLRHKDMVPSHTIEVPWVEDLVVRVKPAPQPKPKPNLIQTRYEHAQVMLTKHEQTLRRVQSLVTKWRKKVHRYERRAAAGQA